MNFDDVSLISVLLVLYIVLFCILILIVFPLSPEYDKDEIPPTTKKYSDYRWWF